MLFPRYCLLAIAFALLAIVVTDATAQTKGKGGLKEDAGLVDGYDCPNCNKEIDTPDGIPPETCPFCKAKLTKTKKPDGTYSLSITETKENPYRKYWIWGGGILFVLSSIGVILKYTVFAPAKPKKKKKKRRVDDDDDDRPRKKRPVVEDEDRPRKVKKPRIVEDDE